MTFRGSGFHDIDERMALLEDGVRARRAAASANRTSDPAAHRRDTMLADAWQRDLERLRRRSDHPSLARRAFRGLDPRSGSGDGPDGCPMMVLLLVGAVAPIGSSDSFLEWLCLAILSTAAIVLVMLLIRLARGGTGTVPEDVCERGCCRPAASGSSEKNP